MSRPAISKHLKVLERAGLISRGRDAQRRPCRLRAKPLAAADKWLQQYRRFWEGSEERGVPSGAHAGAVRATPRIAAAATGH